MNCKNCGAEIDESTKFCPNCGAKVVNARITFRQMMIDMFRNIIGLDNTYLHTLKSLLLRPQEVFEAYMQGVRKRYFAPFGFFAIGAAISLFAFNQFSEQYIAMSKSLNERQLEMIDDSIGPDRAMDAEERQSQLENSENIQRTLLKYFNFFSFLLLPFYTLMAYIVYRKPHNFGEHLVVNAYLQGVTFLFSALFFLVGVWINPSLYILSIVFTMLYYTYAYGKWYQLSIGKSLVKLLLFLLVLAGVLVAITLIGAIFGIIVKLITG